MDEAEKVPALVVVWQCEDADEQAKVGYGGGCGGGGDNVRGGMRAGVIGGNEGRAADVNDCFEADLGGGGEDEEEVADG